VSVPAPSRTAYVFPTTNSGDQAWVNRFSSYKQVWRASCRALCVGEMPAAVGIHIQNTPWNNYQMDGKPSQNVDDLSCWCYWPSWGNIHFTVRVGITSQHIVDRFHISYPGGAGYWATCKFRGASPYSSVVKNWLKRILPGNTHLPCYQRTVNSLRRLLSSPPRAAHLSWTQEPNQSPVNDDEPEAESDADRLNKIIRDLSILRDDYQSVVAPAVDLLPSVIAD